MRQNLVAIFQEADDALGYIRLQEASTETTIRALWTLYASVKCAKNMVNLQQRVIQVCSF